MKIERIEVFKVQVPTKKVYKMARGTHSALDSVIVKLTTDDGVVGIGESHQGVAGYTPETVDTMHAIITNAYGPALIGQNLECVEDLHRIMKEERMGNLFARSGVEIAIFDALARSRNMSIATMLGGPVRTELGLSASIGIDEPEVVGQMAIDYMNEGFTTVKVKVGTQDVQGDIARVRAVRDAAGDDLNIRVDANSGYDVPTAMTFMRGVGDLGIESVEQPVPRDDFDGMVFLRKLGAAPIMADESVASPEEAYRFIKEGAGDAIKIKLTKVGGYLNARRVIELCESAGVMLVIGQGMCSSLEAAAEVQIACAFNHVCPVAEMVGPTKLKDDLSIEPVDITAGAMMLPKGNGIGVDLSDEKLAQYSVADSPAASTKAA